MKTLKVVITIIVNNTRRKEKKLQFLFQSIYIVWLALYQQNSQVNQHK